MGSGMATGRGSGQMRIAVVGLGSIAGAVADTPPAGGGHKSFPDPRKPIGCLTLERAEATIKLPLANLTDPAQAGPVDWVLLCTKTHQTAAAAPWLARLSTPAT